MNHLNLPPTVTTQKKTIKLPLMEQKISQNLRLM